MCFRCRWRSFPSYRFSLASAISFGHWLVKIIRRYHCACCFHWVCMLHFTPDAAIISLGGSCARRTPIVSCASMVAGGVNHTTTSNTISLLKSLIEFVLQPQSSTQSDCCIAQIIEMTPYAILPQVVQLELEGNVLVSTFMLLRHPPSLHSVHSLC